MLTAQKLVSQVQQRVSDTAGGIWTPTQILEAADFAMNHVRDTVLHSGQDHELDRLEIAPTSLTRVEDLWYEAVLPEWVANIRWIEGVTGLSDARPIDFLPSMLEQKDISRVAFLSTQPRWFRSRQGRPGSIGFMGEVNSFTSLRIWFLRRYPGLHYGTAANGSTSTVVFSSSPVGVVTKRDDLYIGMDVYFTSGNNTDQVRRITDYVASTNTATFDPVVGTAVGGTSTYSLVVPLEAEHGEYFVMETTRRLLSRLANTEHLAAIMPEYNELKERFISSLGQRDQARPKKLWSKRR